MVNGIIQSNLRHKCLVYFYMSPYPPTANMVVGSTATPSPQLLPRAEGAQPDIKTRTEERKRAFITGAIV